MPTQEFLQLVDNPRVQTQQEYILACKQYLARKLTKVKVFRSKDKPILVQAEVPECNPINFIIKYKCSEDRQVTQFLTRVNRLLAGVTDYRTIPYTVSYVASGSD